MSKGKHLYAYFGNYGINKLDIPGHSLYQLALLDSISENVSHGTFDIFSYVPSEILEESPREEWPNTPFGEIHARLEDEYVDEFIGNNHRLVIDNISEGKYDKIYLKARFRNLSTLSKGWNDAQQFEEIIQHCIYEDITDKVVILDTDLSLSESFIKKLEEHGITRAVPSIDFPVISKKLLGTVKEAVNYFIDDGKRVGFSGYYYGNLKFGNYKAGHEKNEIIYNALHDLNHLRQHQHMFTAINDFPFKVFGKAPEDLTKLDTIDFRPRWERDALWETMEQSSFSINVSKDLYLEKGFIPSRVHEALLFGNIPVSYSPNGEYKWLHPAMQFSETTQFANIIKFLSESSHADLLRLYNSCVDNYIIEKYGKED